jgi:hypothetical protein
MGGSSLGRAGWQYWAGQCMFSRWWRKRKQRRKRRGAVAGKDACRRGPKGHAGTIRSRRSAWGYLPHLALQARVRREENQLGRQGFHRQRAAIGGEGPAYGGGSRQTRGARPGLLFLQQLLPSAPSPSAFPARWGWRRTPAVLDNVGAGVRKRRSRGC